MYVCMSVECFTETSEYSYSKIKEKDVYYKTKYLILFVHIFSQPLLLA